MPTCRNCGSQLDEGQKNCSQCGASQDEKVSPEKTAGKETETEVFLMSVADGMQANMTEALLNSYDIPVRRKYRENGAFMEVYMGNSNLGIDIFVPHELLEKAQEIIKSAPLPEDIPAMEQPETLMEQYKSEYDKKRRVHSRIILLVFVIPVLIVMIVSLLNLIRRLLS